MLGRRRDDLTLLDVELQHPALARGADARLVELRGSERHIGTRRRERRLELIGRRQVRLGLRLSIRQALALDALLRLGETAAGVGELLLGRLAPALAGKGGVELEARTDHLAFGGEHVVLALGHVLAAAGRRLGVALALAQAGLGFRRGEARARLLVVEADEQLTLLDVVVELHRHVGDLAEDGGADVDLAGARLDAARSGGDPLRAGLGCLLDGLGLAGEVGSLAQHVAEQGGGDQRRDDTDSSKHGV